MSADEGASADARRPVRVWVDGCFDLVHFGHANALRQAKAMGDYLVVGIRSDDHIKIIKGPPVMSENERCKLIRSIKWVDEVVIMEGIFRGTHLDLMEQYNCDFCAHGDDVAANANGGGRDPYEPAKKVKRYREFQRTQGVSTTDLLERILAITQTADDQAGGDPQLRPCVSMSQLFLTSQKIAQFIHGSIRRPEPGDTVVYTAGVFDLFHTGIVDFLEKCCELGDYIVVGLYDDSVVNRYKGSGYPVLTLRERVLNVMACKFVSEVVIAAPYSVPQSLLDHFKVDLVVHGTTPIHPDKDGSDPYTVPKSQGIFKIINSGSKLNTGAIMQRVNTRRSEYQKRNTKQNTK